MAGKQRGRASAASQAVAPVLPGAGSSRLDAPPQLSDFEAEIWLGVVNAMPGGWFDGSSEATLVSYCKHVATARVLDEELMQFKPEWLKEPDGLERYKTLTDMREKQTRAITACARSMRLTHQAQIQPRGAGRAKGKGSAGDRRPWETA